MHDKRCLLAYLYERLLRIRKLRWEAGAKLPKYLIDNFSKFEKEFFSNYDELLSKYNESFEGVIDLTSDLNPPKDVYIEVKVLKDMDKIMTESGVLNLTKNSVYFLKRSDAEKLIQQGIVEQRYE